MDERSLSGLKLALIDPDIRVRLDGDQSRSPESVILGMWVTGGFFDGQMMRFNDNVSCLIGDTGSGKSATIELIRFALDQSPRVPKIREEVDSLVKHQLGSSNTVHVILRKGDAHYLVERPWGEYRVPPFVQRLSENSAEQIRDVDLQMFFPMKGFSQSEIIEFAREPEVRLSLTDDLIDITAELAAIQETKTELRQNAADIMAEKENAINATNRLRERPGLVEAVKEIDKVLDDPRIPAQQSWYTEQNLLNHVDTRISELKEELDTAFDPFGSGMSWPDNVDELPNSHLLGEIQSVFDSWEEYVKTTKCYTESKLSEVDASITAIRDKWQKGFEIAEQEYRDLLESLDEEGIGVQAMSRRREELQQRVSELDSVENDLQTKVLPEIDSLQSKRESKLTELQDHRRRIARKREEKADELTTKLDHKIRLRIHARANKSEFTEKLEEISNGSHVRSSDLQCVATEFHPVSFVKLLLARDFEPLTQRSGVESSKFEKISETIAERGRLRELYELQLTDVEDAIEVQLEVEDGQYRDLEDLSHGQKCMVVLMVALAEGDTPLLVDQPEDALHAPSIEEGIVKTLRKGRGDRQCIFATRNANILVSADSEQIIALQADANRGEVIASGSLDSFDHRQLIIYHVEGGEDAFRRRQTKYTLQPSIQ